MSNSNDKITHYTKSALTKALALGAAFGVAAGMGSLLNSTETKARTKTNRQSAQTKPTSHENFSTKRPSTNGSSSIDHVGEHNTKDFIAPPMSLYNDDSNESKKSSSKDKRKSQRNRGNRRVVSVSTKK